MPEKTAINLRRIAAVTGGLIVVGAIVGGITSMLALTIFALADGSVGGLTLGLGFAGVVGAIIGAVLAPLEAWILLRQVPLWRAIAETAAGTLLGALAFAVLTPGPIIGAVVGFTLAAVRLRITTARGKLALNNKLRAEKPGEIEGEATD